MEREEAEQLFRERVRIMRERRGLSIEALAEQVGVSYQTLYRIEVGLTKSTTVSLASQIARALHTSLDFLSGIYDEHEALAAGLAAEGSLHQSGAYCPSHEQTAPRSIRMTNTDTTPKMDAAPPPLPTPEETAATLQALGYDDADLGEGPWTDEDAEGLIGFGV